MTLADKCRTVAAYHGSSLLVEHARHLEEVVQIQRAALLEAADRIEQLEAEAASHGRQADTLPEVTHAAAN